MMALQPEYASDLGAFAPQSTAATQGSLLLMRQRYIVFLGFVLAGYSLAGRGFAYLGVPPLFIGEIALILGLVAMATAHNVSTLFRFRYTWPLFGLFAWGALQTLPYLPKYGIDCLRDGVGWGYGTFALIVAAMILDSRPAIAQLVDLYRRFFKLFLVGIPISFTLYRSMSSAMPRWPWVDIKMLQVKEGDAMVHLSGILAFGVSGLAGEIGWGWAALLTLNCVVMGVIDRAGMVAFMVVFGICTVFRPRNKLIFKLAGIIVAAILLLWVTDLHVPVPDGKGRDISLQQVVKNLGSVAGDSGSDGLDSTKEWRIEWWHCIMQYTLHGKYFWTGKGFGINLADEDGFQMLADHSLRNPHSVHMTMLARGGVPMLGCWITSIGCWYWLMGRCLVRAHLQEQHFWEGLFFFLATYLTAFLINGSFDVFIEGPMGGIWLWTIYGTGLGSAIVFTRECEALESGVSQSEAGTS
jgi:hypothetical protein